MCFFLLRGLARAKANNYQQKERRCQAGGTRNGAESRTLLPAGMPAISMLSSVCNEAAVPPWMVFSYANRLMGHVILPGIYPHT